jgi:thiamine pyrophosphate-dependent acetolactate synthase large subunit-like protein
MPKMTGSRIFAEAMQSYGVTHVFFVPTIMLPALAEMEDMNIRRVMTHGEKAAAYMADGYARALRKPGICMAQTVGAANLAAGLRDAYLAGSPVIAITGGRQPETMYRHVYQEIEDLPMFNTVTKFNAQVDKVERLPDLLRQAFRAATSRASGPVHLEMRGSHGHVVEEEDDLELVVEASFLQYPAFRPEPEGGRVREAARLLTRAQRPVIVAGGGVTASQAAPEVVELAERLSMPVATSLNGKGTIADHHPRAGSLGWSFPASLGVKCALPDTPVLCFTGDGGFYYHLAELETAARFGINAVILVNNNHSLNQETRLFDAAYGGQQRGRAHEMWQFHDTHFAQVAQAMGCFGVRVERPNDLQDALKQAFAANRPAVVEVLSDLNALASRPWTPASEARGRGH